MNSVNIVVLGEQTIVTIKLSIQSSCISIVTIYELPRPIRIIKAIIMSANAAAFY